MRIPRKRIICGKEWKIKQRNNLKYDDGSPIYGLCDFDNRTILIKKNMTKKQKVTCLCHELIHGLLYEINLNLDFDQEEHVVESIEIMLNENFTIKPKRY